MNEQDYELIAQTIARTQASNLHQVELKERLIRNLTILFDRRDPNFDPAMFLEYYHSLGPEGFEQ